MSLSRAEGAVRLRTCNSRVPPPPPQLCNNLTRRGGNEDPPSPILRVSSPKQIQNRHFIYHAVISSSCLYQPFPNVPAGM